MISWGNRENTDYLMMRLEVGQDGMDRKGTTSFSGGLESAPRVAVTHTHTHTHIHTITFIFLLSFKEIVMHLQFRFEIRLQTMCE